MQEEVEKALKRLQWQGSHIQAAGRTDTGVHALGQVVAFDLQWDHPEVDLRQALNAYLPEDIAARQVRAVSPSFDPRRHASARCYRYQVFCEATRNPLRERYAWRVWPAVEVSLLQQAASRLIGKHDFCAFGTPPRANGTTVRTVMDARWQASDAGLVFEVTADAFLYHMVRRMVALQVAVGQAKTTPDRIGEFLDPAQQNHGVVVQGLAPAQGLCLVHVEYQPEKLAVPGNQVVN